MTTEKRDSSDIDVAYVAHLARLHLTADERECFQAQLEQIVHYVRKIGEADLRGVEPTAHVVPIRNIFREDESREGLDRDEVLANAPSVILEQFQVPRIVE
jgi:aspartyl-tRNA(Asn)/glutamyl-tRNA(Gln) amidotransferase subunit C